jgi:hypothetical protein
MFVVNGTLCIQYGMVSFGRQVPKSIILGYDTILTIEIKF